MLNKNINNFFFILFSIIPISVLIGPAVSLLNILLIDFCFLALIIFKKNYSFLKSDVVKYLFILYVYLLFNSLISIDQKIGFFRNFGFIRFIILFAAFNYFFNQKFFLKHVLIAWSLILSFILIDIYFEKFMGYNLAGFESPYEGRIVSFFREEPIVGGFINSFYLILIGYFHEKFYKNNDKMVVFLSLIFFIAIFLTGERSNTIKAFLGIVLFYTFFKHYKLRYKLILILIGTLIISSVVLNSQFYKNRYIGSIKASIYENQKYFKLYRSGYEVFKNNLVFGVGNKNYRVETCNKENQKNIKSENYVCSTHPHQIYFEFLSEHGIFGTVFILFIFYKLVFSKVRNFKKLNYIQFGSFIYIIFSFLPLLPSGAFFSDYLITLLGLNIAIFYASSPKLNVFSINKENKID